eukprot:COSAG02_NODE_15441_length_1171_cov_1.310634_1_plen_24_part_01
MTRFPIQAPHKLKYEKKNTSALDF